MALKIPIARITHRYSINGVIYLKDNHFTSGIIKPVRYHDGILTGVTFGQDGVLHALPKQFLNTCNIRGDPNTLSLALLLDEYIAALSLSMSSPCARAAGIGSFSCSSTVRSASRMFWGQLPALDVLGGGSWIPPQVEAYTPHPCFRRRMVGAPAPTSVTSVASPSGCSAAAPFWRCADVWSSAVVVRVAADVQCGARAAGIFDPYVPYRPRRREESYPPDPGPAGKGWAWTGKCLRLGLRLVCGLTTPVLRRSRMPRTHLLGFQI
ncbi:hypothetical protein C8J57DRAFT_1240897 [Mycena rebaudengoi]|nr:hypothetical protein C8J57DRAFT_1240897 [Mycena rebaudengoi]